MVLSKLRLLASARFDSQALLCVVLSGDARLLDKLRRDELIPLGSRIRTRLTTGPPLARNCRPASNTCSTAGNAGLMTKELRRCGGSLMADQPDPFVFPELPDEAAAALDHFLEDLHNSFQQRYGIQLYLYYRAIEGRAAHHRLIPSSAPSTHDPLF